MESRVRQIERADIDAALREVAEKCSADTVNLLRAVCDAYRPEVYPVEIDEAASQALTALAGWYHSR